MTAHTLAPLLMLLAGVAVAATAGAFADSRLAERVMPWVEPGWQPHQRIDMRSEIHRLLQGLRERQVRVFCAAVISGITLFLTHSAVASIAFAGFSWAMWVYAEQVRMRQRQRILQQRISAEVPLIADHLALCVCSGMTIETALIRVAASLTGEIVDVLTRQGSNPELTPADSRVEFTTGWDRLRSLARESDSRELHQLLDAIAASAARGTPLAEVLFAQAQASRRAAQQQLLAHSGRREVLMLIPIVFVIFPVVVAVALFPAWQQLRGFGW